MFNFNSLIHLQSQLKKPNPSKIYFTIFENASSDLKEMKLMIENIFSISCPKCEYSSGKCLCEPEILKFQELFTRLLYSSSSSGDLKQKVDSTLKSVQKTKSICGKILKKTDIGFKCFDCELDPTCIICQECFEKSDHKGHRVLLQSSCSGCCDCGDKEAWKPEGFCIDHKGFQGQDQETVKLFPKEFIKNYFDSFRMLFYLFFVGCEDFFTRCGNNSPSMKLMRLWMIIMKTIKMIHNEQNYALNILLCELLREGLRNENYKLSHECNNHLNIYLDNNKKVCECSILKNIFRFNLLLPKENQKQIAEICITLFEFYEFKQYLTILYAQMFSFFFRANKHKKSEELISSITDLNVQFFTSDDLIKNLIDNEVFEQFMEYFVKCVAEIKKKIEDCDFYKLRVQFHHLENLTSKPAICQYLCSKLIFFDKFFEILSNINQIVSFDLENIKERSEIENQLSFVDIELILTTILRKILASSIENLENTHREAFLDHIICSLMKEMKRKQNFCDFPSFHLPLQRAFALVLSVKLYYNKELMKREFLENYLKNMCFSSLNEFRMFILRQFSIISQLLIFLKEIESGVWNIYSNLFIFYSKFHQNEKLSSNFYDLDYVFIQMMMILLNKEGEEDMFLELFLKKNPVINEFIEQVGSEKGKKEEFTKEKIDFLERILDFIITVTSTVNLPLLNCWGSFKTNKEIEEVKNAYIELVLENIVIQFKSLKFKKIKENASIFLSEKFSLESSLEKIANFDKKTKLFSLKEEDKSKINPFIFIKASTFLYESFENLNRKFKDLEPLCLNFRDSNEFFSTYTKSCIQFICPNVLSFLINILIQSKKLIKYPVLLKKSLKIVSIFLQNLENPQLLHSLKIEDFRNSLRQLQEYGLYQNIESTVQYIFSQIDGLILQTKKKDSLDTDMKEESLQIKGKSSSEKKENFLQKQKELREKMLAQQSKFMQKNKEFLEEEFQVSHQTKVCVFCKEEIKKNSIYGQCAYFSESNVLNYAAFQQVLAMSRELSGSQWSKYLNSLEWDSILINRTKEQFFFSSCFHYLHYSCYREFANNNKIKGFFYAELQFNCPLCQRISNILLPNSSFLEESAGFCHLPKETKEKNEKMECEEKFPFLIEKFQGNKGKIEVFFDDVMKINCLNEKKNIITIDSIIENSLCSIIEYIPVIGFEYFLNKQLVLYKNLLYIYRFYLQNIFEMPNKEAFVKDKRLETNNMRSLLTNEKLNSTEIVSLQIDKMFIIYSFSRFLYFGLDDEVLHQDLCEVFNYCVIWKIMQFYLKKNHQKKPNPEFNKQAMKDILQEKEFLKTYLMFVKNFAAIILLIFNFEDDELRELNSKTFTKDEEEIENLYDLIKNKNNLSTLIENNSANFEQFVQQIFEKYDKLEEEKQQFLFIFESLKLDRPLYFRFYELNETFGELMSFFSQKKCDLCGNFPKIGELCLCLICGIVICNRACKNNAHQEKGNLNNHACEFHCGNSIFINMQNSDVFFVASPKNLAEKSILYIDKYGQNIKLKSDWGRYKLCQEKYDSLKEIVLKNEVMQEIWYRSVKENSFFRDNVF